MQIFFEDPSDIPVPREQVRIREFNAQPYPDGRKMRVYLELTPFQFRPDAEIYMETPDGERVTSASVIETISPKLELTLHVPRGARPGEYSLRAVVFYRIGDPSEESANDEQPEKFEILEVDRGETTISIA